MKTKFKLLILLFFTCVFCLPALAKEKIIIGLDINVPPMGFIGSSGDIVGFDIDLANEVFKNFNVIFQPIDWDSKEMELESGKIDVIWNGLSKTPEREKSMLLTRSYLKNRQIVVVNKNSEINSLKDLENKVVCVQKGSTGAHALNNSDLKPKIKETIELENMVNCLNEVETFKSDATILDEIVAKYYFSKLKNNDYKILKQEISSEFYVVAVKKGNEKLKDLIEIKLGELYKLGKTAEICKKWFGQDLFYWQDETSEISKFKAKKLDWLVPILQGVKQTLLTFIITITFSLPLGLILYILQNLKSLKILFRGFINLMRGTPLLLQLFFVFYGLPHVPIVGQFLTINDRFLAGIITFMLNYSAYFAEIFRGGFLSIDKGQVEAAKMLGIGKFKTFFKILLPQAIKICLPSICNESVTLVKDTALMFAIGVQELLSNTKNIVNSTANITPYIAAFAIYLVICSFLVTLFKELEKKFKF